MTNSEQIEKWHREQPDFVSGWSALHWNIAELVAEKLDAAREPEPESCARFEGTGRYCVLQQGHRGSCKTFADDGSD